MSKGQVKVYVGNGSTLAPKDELRIVTPHKILQGKRWAMPDGVYVLARWRWREVWVAAKDLEVPQ